MSQVLRQDAKRRATDATTGPPRKRGLWSDPARRFRALSTVPIVAAMAAFIGYSVGYLVYMSLRDANVFDPAASEFVGLATINQTLSSSRTWSVLGNSVQWVLFSVAAIVVLGTVTGIYLSASTRITRFAQAFMLLPWVLPGIVVAALWKWGFSTNAGLVNDVLLRTGVVAQPISWLGDPSIALYAICIVIVWRLFPLFALVVASAVQTISSEIFDAAEVDGASKFQTIWRITLPLIRPQLATMALLVTIWTANNLVFVQAMTGGGPAGSTEILPVFIYSLMFDSFSLSQASVASLINTALLVVIGAGYLWILHRQREAAS